MSIVMWVCTSFGSSLTQMATSIGYQMPTGAVDITALSAGNWVTWVAYEIGRLSSISPFLTALFYVLIIVGMVGGVILSTRSTREHQVALQH